MRVGVGFAIAVAVLVLIVHNADLPIRVWIGRLALLITRAEARAEKEDAEFREEVRRGRFNDADAARLHLHQKVDQILLQVKICQISLEICFAAVIVAIVFYLLSLAARRQRKTVPS